MTDAIAATQFWTYFDLKDRRIVGSRTDLHRKQRFYGFPRPLHLSDGAAVFRVIDVVAWVEARTEAALANPPTPRKRAPTGELAGKQT